MWYWIVKVSILSLVFIFLLHYLYSFFISTLTVPKVKDLVTLPQKKYNEMFDSLQQQQQQMPLQPMQRINGNNENGNSTNASTQSMKEDLIHFLKDLGSTSTSTSTSGYPFDSNISSFSFTK
jgi:predicted PurR-regulated permease PerM